MHLDSHTQDRCQTQLLRRRRFPIGRPGRLASMSLKRTAYHLPSTASLNRCFRTGSTIRKARPLYSAPFTPCPLLSGPETQRLRLHTSHRRCRRISTHALQRLSLQNSFRDIESKNPGGDEADRRQPFNATTHQLEVIRQAVRPRIVEPYELLTVPIDRRFRKRGPCIQPPSGGLPRSGSGPPFTAGTWAITSDSAPFTGLLAV